MAEQPYIIDPSQTSSALMTTLGAANLATLAGGELTIVPALPSDQTNWYFNFIDPGYQDYYDWSPTADGSSGTASPAPVGGSTGGTTQISAVPAPGVLPPAATGNASASALSAQVGSGQTAPTSPTTTVTASAPGTSVTPPAPSPVTVVINVPTQPTEPAAPAPTAIAPTSSATAPVATPPSATAPTSSVPVTPPAPPLVQPAVFAAVAPAMVAAATQPTAPTQVSVARAAMAPLAVSPAASAPQAIGAPTAPDPIVSATSFSPRFRESKAHLERDSLFEEMLDAENVTVHWVTHESAPLPIAVPTGCDSVEIFYGPVTVNPSIGNEEDVDQLITLGTPQIQHDGTTSEGSVVGELTPGSALMVTIPWRAASFVTLGAKHLMATVYARFYANMQPLDDE